MEAVLRKFKELERSGSIWKKSGISLQVMENTGHIIDGLNSEEQGYYCK